MLNRLNPVGTVPVEPSLVQPIAGLITMAAMATDLRPMYKKLLQLAKSLPEPKRQSTIEQIRTEFRVQRDVSDPKECVLTPSLRADDAACQGAYGSMPLSLCLQDLLAAAASAIVHRIPQDRDAACVVWCVCDCWLRTECNGANH